MALCFQCRINKKRTPSDRFLAILILFVFACFLFFTLLVLKFPQAPKMREFTLKVRRVYIRDENVFACTRCSAGKIM